MRIKNVNVGSSIRIILCAVLFLTLLTLRIVGYVDWPWIWVAAPLWASLVALVIGAYIFGIVQRSRPG